MVYFSGLRYPLSKISKQIEEELIHIIWYQ